MGSDGNSGLSYGTKGNPQPLLEEDEYETKEKENEEDCKKEKPRKYKPSKKHNPLIKGRPCEWSNNPIKSQKEGQYLLDTGIKEGKQIYNVTKDGEIIKFQPDNTPDNGYMHTK